MTYLRVLALAALLAPAVRADAPTPGGDLTRPTGGRTAFSLAAPNVDAKQLRDFNFGNRLFNTNWVQAPASVDAFDGLGPTFNRVSCSGCHLRDGRGRPPIEGEDEFLSMLFRISVPGNDELGGPLAHPDYGDQLNDRANPGVPAEGRAHIEWREQPGEYPDGTPYSLRVPTYTLHDPAFAPFGDVGDDILLSPRVAPHVVGMGLLEAIPEADILARADPDDADGDGISGRPNRVYDAINDRRDALGRFGWKANVATLMQQTAGAAQGDIGLTSRHFPIENCPKAQAACRAAKNGGEPELPDPFLDKLVLYMQVLAVPARRNVGDDTVAQGERLFAAIGCADCHTPVQRTAEDAKPDVLAGQTFMPYTDLLLHDMGEGLADGRPDFLADGREWRTAPLWGLGLVPEANDHSFYLHDGRARSLEEAILWHGGEGERAKTAFMALPKTQRAALIRFLESI